jgi:aspartate/glutamate racemase
LLAFVYRIKTKRDPPSVAAATYGEAGIDGVILAGTELPLILRDPDYKGIPFLNTTKIHCEAAVAEMFSPNDGKLHHGLRSKC